MRISSASPPLRDTPANRFSSRRKGADADEDGDGDGDGDVEGTADDAASSANAFEEKSAAAKIQRLSAIFTFCLFKNILFPIFGVEQNTHNKLLKVCKGGAKDTS